MSNFIDLTGMRFGRLVVIERAENKGRYTAWKCRCDCGNETVVSSNNLKSGGVKSCGCLHRELTAKRATKHGMKHTQIYRTWRNVKERCLNPNNKAYKNYGERGITVYPDWIHDFQAFYDYVSQLEHYGEEGYSLDRINNDGNYEPGNVRWADAKTQNNNTRKNHIVHHNGVDMTLSEVAELSGISVGTLWARIKHGDTGNYLFRPVHKKH